MYFFRDFLLALFLILSGGSALFSQSFISHTEAELGQTLDVTIVSGSAYCCGSCCNGQHDWRLQKARYGASSTVIFAENNNFYPDTSIVRFSFSSNPNAGGSYDLFGATGIPPERNVFHVGPRIERVSPNSVRPFQTVRLDFFGHNTNFYSNTGIALFLGKYEGGSGSDIVHGTHLIIDSPTHMSAEFQIPPGLNTGEWGVIEYPIRRKTYRIINMDPTGNINAVPSTVRVGDTVTFSLSANQIDFNLYNDFQLMRPGLPSLLPLSTTIVSQSIAEVRFFIPLNTPVGNDNLIEENRSSYRASLQVIPLANAAAKVSGRLFWDRFGNNVYSPNDDQTYAHRVVDIQPGNYSVLTNVDGEYTAWLPAGSYTASVQNPAPGALMFSSPTNGVTSFTLSTTDQTHDFVLVAPPFWDGIPFIIPPGAARPGFTYAIDVGGLNSGNVVNTLTLKYVHDSILSPISWSVPPVSYTGDTAMWVFNNVSPGVTRTVSALFQIPVLPIATLGQGIKHRVEVGPLANDTFPGNNIKTFEQTLTGSYDPNDKQVFPPPCGPQGITQPTDSVSEYLIRFQNTGNDTAFRVVVIDTLDPNLDLSSLQMMTASHDYYLTLLPGGVLEWTFDNILLPDSNRNEPASHGYLNFTIARNPNLPIGTEIENTAHIYFDFNPPIITNTTLNTLDTATCGFAGTEIYLCTEDSVFLNAFLPDFFTGTWSLLSGSGTILDPTDPQTKIVGLGIGVNEFIWTLTNGTITERDTITVDQSGPPTANAGTDQNILLDQTNLNATSGGRGSWSFISGGGVLTDLHDPNTFVSSLQPGVNDLVWTVVAGNCQDRDTVQIAQVPSTFSAHAGSDDTICTNRNIVLDGNDPVSGNGVWSLVTGTGVITDPTDPKSIFSPQSTGVVMLEWEVVDWNLQAHKDTVTYFVRTGSSPADAGLDIHLCDTNEVQLSAIPPVIGTGFWTELTQNGQLATPASANTAFTALPNSHSRLTWTTQNAGCPPSIDTLEVSFESTPVSIGAGPDQNICGKSWTLMDALSPTGGTGKWEVISGSGYFAPDNTVNSRFYYMGVGQNEVTWTVSTEHCGSGVDTVVITGIDTCILVDAGPDTQGCDTLPITLNGSTPPIGTGYWSVISGSGTFSNINDPITQFSGYAQGTTLLQWNVPNGFGGYVSDTTLHTRIVPPPAANAGLDKEACENSGANIYGNLPPNTTGQWSLVSGSGVIFNPNLPTTGFSSFIVGPNLLVWTLTHSTCPTTTDTMVFSGLASPIANAGPDSTFCDTFTIRLSANTPLSGSGFWHIIAGSGTFSNVTDPNAFFTPSGPGIVRLGWNTRDTINNVICAGIDVVSLTFLAGPGSSPADAGADTIGCVGTPLSLTGNLPSGTTGQWSVLSGAGAFSNPNDPITSFTGFTPGPNLLVWTLLHTTCPPSMDTVQVIGQILPITADAGPDTMICENVPFTLSGNVPGFGTGQWQLLSGSGTLTNPSDPQTQFLPQGNGIVELVWTIDLNGCTSSDSVTISILQSASPAYAGPDSSFCDTAAVFFRANAPSQGTGQWSLLSGSGTLTNPSDPQTQFLPQGNGIFELVWTIDLNGCTSSDSVTISVLQSASPAYAGPDSSFCDTTAIALRANGPTQGMGQWYLISGSGTFTNPLDSLTNFQPSNFGTIKLAWSITSASCGTSADTVSLTFFQPPSLADAGVDLDLCNQDSTVLSGIAPLSGTGQWQQTVGPVALITNPLDPTTTVTGLVSGIYTFKWEVTAPGCPPNEDEMNIINNTLPGTYAAGVDTTVCEDFTTLNADVPMIGTGSWSALSGTGVLGNPMNPQSVVTGLSAGVNMFEWAVDFGALCGIYRDSVSIKWTPPVIPTITQNGNLLTASTANSYQWLLNGTPIAGETGQNYTHNGAAGTFSLTTIDSNGCEATSNPLMLSSVSALQAEGWVQVHPNPAHEYVVVELIGGKGGITELQLMDARGKVVVTLKEFDTHSLRKQIDLRGLSQGIYFLKIQAGDRSAIRKVVLQ